VILLSGLSFFLINITRKAVPAIMVIMAIVTSSGNDVFVLVTGGVGVAIGVEVEVELGTGVGVDVGAGVGVGIWVGVVLTVIV
jgi:hypothetical protein